MADPKNEENNQLQHSSSSSQQQTMLVSTSMSTPAPAPAPVPSLVQLPAPASYNQIAPGVSVAIASTCASTTNGATGQPNTSESDPIKNAVSAAAALAQSARSNSSALPSIVPVLYPHQSTQVVPPVPLQWQFRIPPHYPNAPPIPNGFYNATMDSSSEVPSIFRNRKLRSGKWTPQEEAYADVLIEVFEKGHIDEKNGCTLRSFLSRKLHCAPMRISKKYAGKGIGKMVFLSKQNMAGFDGFGSAVYNESMKRLGEAEAAFIKSIYPELALSFQQQGQYLSPPPKPLNGLAHIVPAPVGVPSHVATMQMQQASIGGVVNPAYAPWSQHIHFQSLSPSHPPTTTSLGFPNPIPPHPPGSNATNVNHNLLEPGHGQTETSVNKPPNAAVSTAPSNLDQAELLHQVYLHAANSVMQSSNVATVFSQTAPLAPAACANKAAVASQDAKNLQKLYEGDPKKSIHISSTSPTASGRSSENGDPDLQNAPSKMEKTAVESPASNITTSEWKPPAATAAETTEALSSLQLKSTTASATDHTTNLVFSLPAAHSSLGSGSTILNQSKTSCIIPPQGSITEKPSITAPVLTANSLVTTNETVLDDIVDGKQQESTADSNALSYSELPDFLSGFDRVAGRMSTGSTPVLQQGISATAAGYRCSPSFTSKSFDDLHRFLGKDLSPVTAPKNAVSNVPTSRGMPMIPMHSLLATPEKSLIPQQECENLVTATQQPALGQKNGASNGRKKIDSSHLSYASMLSEAYTEAILKMTHYEGPGPLGADSYNLFAQQSAFAASQHSAYMITSEVSGRGTPTVQNPTSTKPTIPVVPNGQFRTMSVSTNRDSSEHFAAPAHVPAPMHSLGEMRSDDLGAFFVTENAQTSTPLVPNISLRVLPNPNVVSEPSNASDMGTEGSEEFPADAYSTYTGEGSQYTSSDSSSNDSDGSSSDPPNSKRSRISYEISGSEWD